MNKISTITQNSNEAFKKYQQHSLMERSNFLNAIAEEIELLGDTLLETASQESNLPIARFQGERARTCGQLRMFAEMLLEGSWEQLSIDTALPERTPLPKPDIRQCKLPIGPIVVFGASNFPLAYSTAGGDTASALAAGCSVIYKMHPSHAETSKLVASAIEKAIDRCDFPKDTFIHFEAETHDEVAALIQHPIIQGVGFTGSYHGGMAIHQYAQERIQPIPVFAEMGSVNPVIFLHGALKEKAAYWAEQYTNSITVGVGQFCTNPGLLVGIHSPELDNFKTLLAEKMKSIKDFKMLNEGIYKNYEKRVNEVTGVEAVSVLTTGNKTQESSGVVTFATVSADDFLVNENLHEEVFGPFSMLIECKDEHQLYAVCNAFKGQLTSTIIAEQPDYAVAQKLIVELQHKAGRLVFNNVPTGVEVCNSIVHGGPFPSTTDARFTSVGNSAILRWVRPIAYQNFPQELLPNNLKDANLNNAFRIINNKLSQESL